MRPGSGIVAGLTLLALTGAAKASEDYCIDANTRSIDPQNTQILRELVQGTDSQGAQMFIGAWNAQSSSPATSQVAYTRYMFEPGGLFQYQQRTCGGMTNYCSDAQGVGLYGVRMAGDGSFFGLLMVSDSLRDHACLGFSGRFSGPGAFVDSYGAAWQRTN